jgi:hypothetical protein
MADTVYRPTRHTPPHSTDAAKKIILAGTSGLNPAIRVPRHSGQPIFRYTTDVFSKNAKQGHDTNLKRRQRTSLLYRTRHELQTSPEESTCHDETGPEQDQARGLRHRTWHI